MKKVLVTGASGGIGIEIVRTLVKDGYSIIAHSSSQKSSDRLRIKLVQELQVLQSIKIEYVVCDLSSIDAITDFCKEIVKKHKQDLYGLINNAGVTSDGPLLMASTDKLANAVNINLMAPLLISKAVCKIFLRKKEGVIINVSSVVGQNGNAMQCVYSSTKAALIGLTKSLAKEMCLMTKGDKVRVNAIAPGFIQTSMTDAIPEDFANEIKKSIPMSRVGNPSEVVSMIKFLLSDDASYITGTVLNINGGML